MNRPVPRLTAVLGVTRAMIATLGARDAVTVLLAEFGWDATFQALAMLRDEHAQEAFGLVWQQLLFGPIEGELDVHAF
ncbi:MAG: hypothetical protein KY437_03055 [Actinobacteria bacterium]|nr:hypothetical protein [Actinomycetota bacterium]